MTRFDPSRGSNFRWFASRRIRGAIIDGMRSEALMPRQAFAQSGRVDESETHRPSARADLMVALADAVRQGVMAGDEVLVRVATEALTRLL